MNVPALAAAAETHARVALEVSLEPKRRAPSDPVAAVFILRKSKPAPRKKKNAESRRDPVDCVPENSLLALSAYCGDSDVE
jgi:hypothetical protein